MKILIYSDVHGNLPAFEKILEKETPCDQYICLGDLVNYGPWSNECLELALSLPNSIIIKGNHEVLFLNPTLLQNECDIVKSFFLHSYSTFKLHSKLKLFLDNYQLDDWFFSHTINNLRIYKDTNLSLSCNTFVGHTHHQFQRKIASYTLVNTGSVGQNRSSIDKANYVIYDTISDLIQLKSVTYNIAYLLSELHKQSYPNKCIQYYLNKIKK